MNRRFFSRRNRSSLFKAMGLSAICLATGFSLSPQVAEAAPVNKLVWLNHFDLLPGGDELTTSHNSTSSGVGGGLTGLVIESTTTGDTFIAGGNKVVHMAVEVPPLTGFLVRKVRVCYEVANTSQDTPSFITQIRLAQVQNPPSSAVVMLDDGTDLTDPGPVCVSSAATSIDPGLGPLLLSLRLNFGDTADKIVIRGLGLRLRKPE
jgi:hypothetical protein